MPIPTPLTAGLKLPVVAAPMFLTSGPDLVVACCTSGIIGTFPALNARTTAIFESWLIDIRARIAAFEENSGEKAAAFGVNLIVHKTNPRLETDLEVCIKHRVPLIITSLGAAAKIVEAVHSYGGVVFHDVISIKHARKAAAAGVDGLIGVAAGAGGHAGTLNPFALVNEIRRFFTGTLLLSGCISTGRDIAAATVLGADLAYMGTRFIATREATVKDAYKDMIVASTAADIVYTPVVSGVPASFLRPSLTAAGIDPDGKKPEHIDFGKELTDASEGEATNPGATANSGTPTAWRDIWSAGQGVGSVKDVLPAAELIQRLKNEYNEALAP